jgi:AcrR family transcriptional regulator
MSKARPTATASRRRLTVESIVVAALEHIADAGLDNLTMRAVAARLGSSPMALYRHVADRDELVARTVDQTLADIDLLPHPEPDQARGWLLHMTAAVRQRLRAYPGTADHLLMNGPTGPWTMTFMDRVCHVLADTGRSPTDTAQAYDWLMTTAAAYIAKQDRLDRTGGTHQAATAFANRTAAYARKLPHLARVIPEFRGDADGAFHRAVEQVVDTLLRPRDQPRPA